MANISLQHIMKVYPGGVTAVSDFNLEIDDGEFVVLVGPSGCGKSTVLRMIAGLEEITGGELYIGGRLVNDVSPKDRDIAMVFQTYALYPHMTVYKNMAFSLELRKMPKEEIDKRVRDAARVLDIEQYLGRKPKALSGGQRQRVALGRAMVRDPAVFLLDEPLSNLDAKLRASMRTELIKLHKHLGTTFVYVTHDQTEAMTMGDRIAVMKDGIVQQVDTPQNLYDNPCNVFVAGFIGSPQMNIVRGVLHRNTNDAANADGKSYIQIGDDKLLLPPEKCTNTLLAYASKDVLVGIRSEDIHDDEAFLAENPSSVVTATVDVSELMGSEVFLYLKYQESLLTARVAPNTKSRIGDTVKIGIDTTKIHLFDAETELNISL